MATAEIAVAIPAVVLLLGGLIAVIAAVAAQLRCVDAAREGARAAARGDSASVVVSIAQRAAPNGAAVSVAINGDTVTVTVQAPTRPVGGLVGTYTVTASATGRMEPTSDDAGPVPATKDAATVAGPAP
ncbi:hypothetical protein CLV47_103170 [Antricoccus suffuscus]|uniref:TadE-like protein n=1 Tax=Antricoccus suffuscus TaxID=1629062 RepID=A0A2T1A3D3_9ACTN|nr:TadE family type IV pilus minor pilin [Antricoccus suffuscus]PRZ43113.1 hypothetical protein CLV47_103170 [Antricoccus suffuscus]